MALLSAPVTVLVIVICVAVRVTGALTGPLKGQLAPRDPRSHRAASFSAGPTSGRTRRPIPRTRATIARFGGSGVGTGGCGARAAPSRDATDAGLGPCPILAPFSRPGQPRQCNAPGDLAGGAAARCGLRGRARGGGGGAGPPPPCGALLQGSPRPTHAPTDITPCPLPARAAGDGGDHAVAGRRGAEPAGAGRVRDRPAFPNSLLPSHVPKLPMVPPLPASPPTRWAPRAAGCPPPRWACCKRGRSRMGLA